MNQLQAGMIYHVESFRRSKSGLLLLVDVDEVHNICPTEGLNYMLNVGFKDGTKAALWYLALFTGNYTPSLNDTAATFPAAAGETSAYTQATRVQWAPGTISNGTVDNVSNLATFDMNALVTVYGGALLSIAGKQLTTGTLSSIARFSSPKIDVDQIKVSAKFVMTST